MSPSVLDLFAGPGGWDYAAQQLGLDPLGVEWDDAACETRKVAGLRTLQGNVAELDPSGFGHVDLLIASPPCQAWSMAGKRLGEQDKEHVIACAMELAAGNDTRLEHRAKCEDARSMLVVEPLRFIRHLKPAYVALEQVPPVLELWTLFASLIEPWGYSVWAGVLEAERYGVPQTRERAILIASRRGPVAPPHPTHQRYIPGEPQRHDITFDGEVLPWVSMAEALGWCGGAMRADFGPNAKGGNRPRPSEEPAAAITTKHAGMVWEGVDRWERLPAYRLARGEGMLERHGGRPDTPAEAPAPHITSKARSANWVKGRPAPTLVTTRRSDQGIVVGRQLPEGEGRNVGGRNWGGTGPQPDEAPATTVAGDPRLSSRNHHNHGEQNGNAVRVTEQEAAILQSFPHDYPFQGSRSKRFEQIGNAVPPLLALAILRALLDIPTEERKAA